MLTADIHGALTVCQTLHWTRINWLNPHNNSVSLVLLLSPFYKWGSWGREVKGLNPSSLAPRFQNLRCSVISQNTAEGKTTRRNMVIPLQPRSHLQGCPWKAHSTKGGIYWFTRFTEVRPRTGAAKRFRKRVAKSFLERTTIRNRCPH